MTDSFECDLSSLLGQEVYFYDPYIVDEARAMHLDQTDTEGVGCTRYRFWPEDAVLETHSWEH